MTAALSMSRAKDWRTTETFLFDPEPSVRNVALELFSGAQNLGLICPHGHIAPGLLGDADTKFANPTDLLLRHDHYIFRLLYSQGIKLEDLGVGAREGEYDPINAWQVFCQHFHLFDGTPTGMWLRLELTQLFGITQKPTAKNALELYAQIQAALETPAFTPRALFKRFRIELLATTDAAEDDLEPHRKAQRDGYRMIPTFRPDGVLQVLNPEWKTRLQKLEAISNTTYTNIAPHISRI